MLFTSLRMTCARLCHHTHSVPHNLSHPTTPPPPGSPTPCALAQVTIAGGVGHHAVKKLAYDLCKAVPLLPSDYSLLVDGIKVRAARIKHHQQQQQGVRISSSTSSSSSSDGAHALVRSPPQLSAPAAAAAAAAVAAICLPGPAVCCCSCTLYNSVYANDAYCARLGPPAE